VPLLGLRPLGYLETRFRRRTRPTNHQSLIIFHSQLGHFAGPEQSALLAGDVCCRGYDHPPSLGILGGQTGSFARDISRRCRNGRRWIQPFTVFATDQLFRIHPHNIDYLPRVAPKSVDLWTTRGEPGSNNRTYLLPRCACRH